MNPEMIEVRRNVVVGVLDENCTLHAHLIACKGLVAFTLTSKGCRGRRDFNSETTLLSFPTHAAYMKAGGTFNAYP